MIPSLVAVHGLKRAGKGTVAARLVDRHGFTNVKFAGALKDMGRIALRHVCGLDDADIERCIESDLKEIPIPSLGGKSARYLMQMIGTEWRDSIDSRMWTRIALEEIRRVVALGGRAVVDDLRFHHEVDLVRPEGASLWIVESNRVSPSAGPAILPWDASASPTLAFDDGVLNEILGCFLSHCGLSSQDVVRSISGDLQDVPLAILGGKSSALCSATLRSVLVPLMMLPWTPTSTTTAAHASEQGLPPEIFDVYLRNDGGFDDLYRQVDAVVDGRDAMAA